MEKAIKILRDILASRDISYDITDKQIQDSIKELEKIQDNMQVKILELNANHKQQIKEIKLRFIEDVISLKELIRWKQLTNKKIEIIKWKKKILSNTIQIKYKLVC